MRSHKETEQAKSRNIHVLYNASELFCGNKNEAGDLYICSVHLPCKVRAKKWLAACGGSCRKPREGAVEKFDRLEEELSARAGAESRD